jgi:hypothetical protein
MIIYVIRIIKYMQFGLYKMFLRVFCPIQRLPLEIKSYTGDMNLRTTLPTERTLHRTYIYMIWRSHRGLKQIYIFWEITSCSWVKVNWLFGGNSCYLFRAGFLLIFLFNAEDGGDMSFRNDGCLSRDYTALYPRRDNYSPHYMHP